MRISHEAIYKYIFDKKNIKENDLRTCLTRRHKRRNKKGARTTQKLYKRAHLPKIEDRPVIVETRKRIGD
jgi:IS30 family transposase